MDRRNFLQRGLSLAAATLGTSLGRLAPASAAAPLFADSFARAATRKGWGKAWFNQRYQMAWGIAKKKGFYDLPAPYIPPPDDAGHVGEGAARYSPNPVIVLNRDVEDVDLSVNLSLSNAGARPGLIARSIGYGDYYGAYMDTDAIVISRFTLNRELEIKRVPFAVKAGTGYRLRFKVSGQDLVKLQAKIWKVGAKEPARFTATVTDSEPQRRINKFGAFGLLFMHDYRTRKKARVKVWKFSATSAQTPAKTGPRLTFAFAGPLTRAADGHRITLVAKAEIPSEIKFKVGTDPRLKGGTILPPDEVFAKAGVAKLTLSALPGDTVTYWKAISKSKSSKARATTGIRSFVTPPLSGNKVAFAFGSCTNFYPPLSSFTEAAKLGPLFFVHLGDFGYPEHVDAAALALRKDCFQDRWIRMLGRNASSTLHEKTNWVMTQDDHDYGADNVWKDTVKAFTIPAFDELSGNRGQRHFEMRYGDVHVFVVDCHIASDNPEVADGPNHSILGSVQKSWLKQEMQASDAALLVVLTSLPFWGAGEGRTTWKGGFRDEGQELLNFFKGLQNANRRVLICSGNAHAQFIARHPGPVGEKDLYEFVSSQTDHITNQIASQLKIKPTDTVIDPTRAEKNTGAFGFVELQSAGPNRQLTLRSVDGLTGQNIWDPLVLSL